MPGFVNAHFHSYDGLVKGLLEDMPFDVWALHSQPAYFGPRSRAEIRARTLVGAIECLKHGITTVQDMNSLMPQDEETLDIILSAFAEVGIRVVFSIALRDVAALDIAPFLPADMPADIRAMVEGTARDPHADLAFVERQIARIDPLPARFHWALSPSGPQRASPALLEGIVDMARRHRLPVTTHVLETPAQRAKAGVLYRDHGGSMVRYMASMGLLGPGTTLAHGVWLDDGEIALLAEHGASLAHNPMSNLKLKSGVAPIRRLHEAGVNLALGCDNCSCGDCQSLFQGMKLFCTLAAITDPNPTGVHAVHAIEAATLGGARALGLDGVVGAIRPGMRADLCLIDLSDIALDAAQQRGAAAGLQRDGAWRRDHHRRRAHRHARPAADDHRRGGLLRRVARGDAGVPAGLRAGGGAECAHHPLSGGGEPPRGRRAARALSLRAGLEPDRLRFNRSRDQPQT